MRSSRKRVEVCVWWFFLVFFIARGRRITKAEIEKGKDNLVC